MPRLVGGEGYLGKQRLCKGLIWIPASAGMTLNSVFLIEKSLRDNQNLASPEVEGFEPSPRSALTYW
jgi:hypothetical protein